jgi:hypothetical protein
MSDYNIEQREALGLVRRHLASLSASEKTALKAQAREYLAFREEVDQFLAAHFDRFCTEACFRNRLSACCSRDGIVIFFAEVVINALVSTDAALGEIGDRLARPNTGFKCVFLGETGCLWAVRPIVCAMFLCDSAMEKGFAGKPEARKRWEAIEEQKKEFTWPDRPVLFDALERIFLDAGLDSSLMYCHNSPGLIRVKKKAGLM